MVENRAIEIWTIPLLDRLHVGGGITNLNAQEWIDAGAEKVRRVARLNLTSFRLINPGELGHCHLLPFPRSDVLSGSFEEIVRGGREEADSD